MTKILFFFLILFLLFSCKNKKKNELKNSIPEKLHYEVLSPAIFIPELSRKLIEISGIITYDDLFWGFNDSGGANRIYAFNKSGKIEKEIELKESKNRDWESITQDNKHIYIGDFGNNFGTRKNLCIYKIKKKDIGKKKEQKIESQKIDFTYLNQDKFLYLNNKTPFDCEAIVEFDGSLYIFSKNWKEFTTTVYKIPTKKGHYKLKPFDTFNVNGLVTGADVSPDKKQLALVGYRNYKSFIWVFSNFRNDKFFEGDHTFFEIPEINGAQTEGICFLGNDSLLVSCENSRGYKQQVYLFNLLQ
jgi:hypothetical protein